MARILTGGSADSVLTHEPLGDFLFRRLAENGDQTMLTNGTTKKHFTFREVLDISKRLAVGLQSMGYRKGHILTIYGFNSEDFVFIVLASVKLGIVVNTVNPVATPYELDHYLREVQPSIIFTEETLLSKIEAVVHVVKPSPCIITRQNTAKYHHLYDIYSRSPSTDLVSPLIDTKNDVAFILFSSGTSGLPKGVLLTSYNVTSLLILLTIYGSHPDITRSMNVFPMYHGGGLFMCCLGCISSGYDYIFMEKYNFKLFLECIQSFKPQGVLIPPPLVVQMAKSPLVDQYDISSVKFCHTGAAPVKMDTEESFRKRCIAAKIQQSYGMTEATTAFVWRGYDTKLTDGPGSSGKPGIGVEIKVINPETGQLLEPNTRGELLCRTPTLMKGYLNKPETTKETIDGDGWLHTGDIGYYDDDGFIYIVDRLKELIKYKGNQVAPAELEALLLEHPDVADAGVIGIPDEVAGELPRAYIVKQAGSNVTADAIHKFVNGYVSYYKQLRGGVIFLDSIPKLPSGKILRRALRQMATNNSKL